ncbi:MAG TPA: hypothetical protein VF472_07485 [Burkholderiaceae bacterium]
MTPYQAFLFARAIYSPIQSAKFGHVLTVGDLTVGLAYEADGNTIAALPGSQRKVDFEDDADMLPFDAGPLGMVHGGSYRGMPALFEAILPYVEGELSIVGHSLGAMRAGQLAGLCAIGNVPVAQLFMYEPAKPGYARLGDLVRAHVPFILGTRNARDFVPDMPPVWPFPYRHIVDLVDLDYPAPGVDPIEDHLLDQIGPAVLLHWPDPEYAPDSAHAGSA